MNAGAIWNDFWARVAGNDRLVFVGLALFAACLAYPLVRLLMRRRWLRILMRVLFFGGVAVLVAVAAVTLSYYEPAAWASVVGILVSGTFAPPVMWIFGAVVIATGLALRKPVAPRHRIRVSTPPHDEPEPREEAVEEPLPVEPEPSPEPWPRAA